MMEMRQEFLNNSRDASCIAAKRQGKTKGVGLGEKTKARQREEEKKEEKRRKKEKRKAKRGKGQDPSAEIPNDFTALGLVSATLNRAMTALGMRLVFFC